MLNRHSTAAAKAAIFFIGTDARSAERRVINPGEKLPRGAEACPTNHKKMVQTACINCNWQKLCLPSELSPQEMSRIDKTITARRRLRRCETLFHNGDDFTGLYAIRSGFFKTSTSLGNGREQVTGFQMPGEILGLDGILNEQYTCSAVALQDAEVCPLPLDRIAELSALVKPLQHHVFKIMSREIVQAQEVMLMLGSMRSDERLAAFLLNLVRRLHARGFSRTELILQMTREEIGSYLGMKIETVSRIFTRLMEQGMVEVNQRHIHILDPVALNQSVSQFEGMWTR
jgi:CRP/FNR family transcriptional regulator